MGTVPSLESDNNLITHSICMKCARKMFADIGANMGDFLDTLGAPVILIDAEGTVRMANRQAQAILGKSLPDIQGYRGGNVFSCAYANLPGGCGATGHCEACKIRQTVTDTYATGTSYCKVPACLDRGVPGDTRQVKFLISTEKRENYVVLRIDEVGGDT